MAVKEKAITWRKIKRQKELILISIPFVIYVLVFNYAPLVGWVMAFQRYKPKDGILGSQFVGLEKFKFLFANDMFTKAVRNTLMMGLINLVFSFFFSILLAVLLSEVKNRHAKKAVQTISYLPHFLSWIIVTGILHDALMVDGGVVNDVLVALHVLKEPINWLAYPKYFWWLVGFANVWKETGWGAIIYIASITAISPDLYEAAAIDGAGRIQRILHITLPGIKATIFILLLINIGNILNIGFEVQYLLGNGLVLPVSQTIDIYILKYGISQADYALGTAAGIFKSVVSFVMVFGANKLSRHFGEEQLF